MRRAAPLILGAGPAGCAAAIALARRGLEPLLLDRDTKARDQLCGGFLSWRTVARLRDLGIEPASLGARGIETLALFVGVSEVAVPLPEIAFALSRRALDQALRDRAVALGARLAIDHVRGIDGTTVLGRERTWAGSALFLATGKHDVRGLVRPRRSSDPALGLRLRLSPSAAREAMLAGRIELHMFAGGYAGIVLQEDGSTNVCLAMRKWRLTQAGGDPTQMLSDLALRYPAFGLRLADDWRGIAVEPIGSIPYGWLAENTTAGVFRLGDQAAVIPSLAGEGIAIALASGEAAARYWLAQGPGGAAAYQRELAERAKRPMRAARLAWAIAENPRAAELGIALGRRLPMVMQWLMRASRLRSEPPLAYSRLAP